MSALPPKADIVQHGGNVPKADILTGIASPVRPDKIRGSPVAITRKL
jgi:hypothetical protein